MLTNQIQIFPYNGSPVTFQKGDSVMVNATEMAKPFGKSATHWLRNKSTEEFIKELSKLRKSNLGNLVQVTYGGDTPGTWMHEDVAMEFARWLSPAFAIWCNDHIKELLTTGVTTVNDDDATIAHAMEILNKRLEQAKAEKLLLEEQNQQQLEVIKEQAPKVDYYDNTLQSVNTMTTTQAAKSIGWETHKLNCKLKDAGIIFSQSGQWMLRSPYSHWELHKTRTNTYTRSDGSIGTSVYTVWTERGRRFISALVNNLFSVPNALKELRGELTA